MNIKVLYCSFQCPFYIDNDFASCSIEETIHKIELYSAVRSKSFPDKCPLKKGAITVEREK